MVINCYYGMAPVNETKQLLKDVGLFRVVYRQFSDDPRDGGCYLGEHNRVYVASTREEAEKKFRQSEWWKSRESYLNINPRNTLSIKEVKMRFPLRVGIPKISDEDSDRFSIDTLVSPNEEGFVVEYRIFEKVK